MKLLLIITLISLFHIIKPEPSSWPVSFKLALQWPNSVCNTHHSVLTSCRRPIPQRFTIRGLWAFDASGKSIPYCEHGTLLLPKEVDYKRYELQHEWPNLLGGDYEFWSKEWKKHGRCLSGMTPKMYFDTAIDLMENIGSLLDVLHGKGLSPDINQLHATHDFPIAIQDQIYATTEIKCNIDLHGRSQLHEVFSVLPPMECCRIVATTLEIHTKAKTARATSYFPRSHQHQHWHFRQPK